MAAFPSRSIASKTVAILTIAVLAALVPLAAPPRAQASVVGADGVTAVDIALDADGSGFWLLDELGGVHPVNAHDHGDVHWSFLQPSERAVAIAATTSGRGYWIFTSAGRVVGFGDAVHHGDTSDVASAGPIVDAAASATGEGYVLVSRDGSVFTFGDALHHGSPAELSITTTASAVIVDDTGGYQIIDETGAVYAFAAPFHGGANDRPGRSMVDATFWSGGYVLLESSGMVERFGRSGRATTSPGGHPSPAVAVAADPAGGRMVVAHRDGIVTEYRSVNSSVSSVVAAVDTGVAPMQIDPVHRVVGTRDNRVGPKADRGAWFRAVPAVQDIRLTSSIDGTAQPAMWLDAPSPGRPLLVVLHSWSATYDQAWSIPYAEWAEQNGWAMIAPNFRGSNRQATATGSDLAVGDVVDAVRHGVANGADPDRVFVVGFSGGGHMSLLMAGRHPELFAGAAAWVPVYDLPSWYVYNEVHAPWRHYIPQLEASCGGAPRPGTSAHEDCLRRSPMAHLDAAREAGVPVYIATGLRDSLVPPSEAARAFNQLAEPEDHFTPDQIATLGSFRLPAELAGQTHDRSYFGPEDHPVFLTRQSGAATFVLFSGFHEMLYEPALRWFAEGAPSQGEPRQENLGVCRPDSSPRDVPPTNSAAGYWMLDSSGDVHAFGVPHMGDLTGAAVPRSMTATPSGNGYWIVDTTGRVHPFGDAVFHGDMRGRALASPISRLVANPAGAGYWLLADDGGVFSFGDAAFHGSTGAMTLAAPIVSMTATPSGGGYWLVGSDGGVFAFGDAPFHGSTGNIRLDAPVMTMESNADGSGYWLHGTDGGVFAFGHVGFHGSLHTTGRCEIPRAAQFRTTASGHGYWIVTTAGDLFAFGDARALGEPQLRDEITIVDLATRG